MIVGTKLEFENLADFVLRDYLGDEYESPNPINIQAFAKDYLKLEISYCQFDPQSRIAGMRTGNQILLDQRPMDDKCVGERNFTIAHECGHDLINWQDPSYVPFFLKCLNKSIKLLAKLGLRKVDARRVEQTRFLKRSSVVEFPAGHSHEIIVVAAFFDVSHNSLLEKRFLFSTTPLQHFFDFSLKFLLLPMPEKVHESLHFAKVSCNLFALNLH